MDQITLANVYPLTQRQKVLLLDAGYVADAKELTETWNFVLRGKLSETMFGAAWENICERHRALRTALVWKRVKSPLQVVKKQARMSLKHYDWRELTPTQQFAEFRKLIQEENEQGFDVWQPPLVRLCLCRTADEAYQVVCSYSSLLFDRRSVMLLFREALRDSAGIGNGHLGQDYVDQVPDYSSARDWWTSTLKDFRASTLPAVRSEADTESFYGEAELELDQSLLTSLQHTASTLDISFDTLLRSAWAVVLAIYSGEERVTFDTEGLPLRVDVESRSTVSAWLKKQDAHWLQLSKLETTPAALIRHWGGLDSNISLFDSRIVLQPQEESNSGGLIIEQARAFALHDTPLIIEVVAREPLKLRATYATDLLDSAAADRLLRHYEQVLSGIVGRTEATVAELELLTEAERERLREWNETAHQYGRDRSIAEVFEEQARLRPEAVALVMGERSLTYEELNRRANQLGHYLRELGVGPEVCVGLCMERSLEMVVGMLGILKAGGAYVPLDASYPTERLAYMLTDAGVAVVLTQESLLETLPSHWGQVVSLDEEWEEIEKQSAANVVSGAAGENLAYVMYTSGSTGEPKGVAVFQRAVVRLVKETNYAQFGAEETFLQLAPLTFDASTFEIWGSLLNGGRLVVMPPDSPSLEELARALQQHHITTLWLTAGLFHLMVNRQLEGLLGLRQLLAGGDVLWPQAVNRVLEAATSLTLINGYGPTENTTFTCCYPMQSGDSVGATVPIGTPISNTKIYILDHELRQVPVGIAGELYIGGDGLARAYHNRPELTANSFLPDPFSGVAGARLYRSGDRVRFLRDGNVEFLGRFDDQVKVRGYRIELGEIETVLATHGAIKEVVVEAREDTPGDKRLVAYVVAEPDRELSTDELRRFVSEKLPDFMVPNNFVMLDHMPLTNNGKIDRRALPEPETLRRELVDRYVASRTEVERQLTAIWSAVLGVERVGVNDDFFELGGHSLTATQLISAVREKLQVELPLRCIFDSPTIAGMAEHVEAMLSVEHKTIVPVITPVARDRALPLSFAQRRMWFLNQLEPESAYYNIPIAMRLTGRLDTHALEKAINEVVRRHEVFRTTIGTEDGEPVQVINEAVHLALTVENISGEGEDRAVELAAEESAKPFDLSRGPLLRIRLLKLGPENFVALFTMHHIISDGWSMDVLVREVATLYKAFVENAPSPLIELPLQYADFAAWQQEWLRGSVLEDQLEYWKQQLSGAPTVLDLPTDKPRPAMQKFRGANAVFSVPGDVTEQLLALSRQEGATLFMTLLAAFNVLLHRYTGQNDILLGTPIANRNRAEIEGLIGFFVNTLVLRAQMESDQSFRSLLRQVRTTTLDAYAHQDLPFEMLVQELQPERDMSRSPLFQVMLVLQNAPSQAFELPGLTLSAFATPNRTAKFELMLTMVERADGLDGALEYDTDLFDATTIERMLDHFQTLLANIVAHPDQRLTEYSLLTAKETQQLLVEWNANSADYPRDACLHELIEAQAERTPHAVALISDDERLSYHELNCRANQLAHYLRERGVGPESIVGVLMERSNDLIATLLGVLKAGGAYVPLDPAYPRERLQLMIEDAGVGLLLTRRNMHDRLQPHNAQLISIDDESTQAALNLASSSNPKSAARPENLIYVLYTSGSTGVPKGVLVTHRGIVNCIAWMQRTYNLNSNDRFLFKTSLNFDASVWEVFWSLTIGAAVVVTRPGGEHDGPYLADTMRTKDVTCVYFVPSMLALWLETPGLDQLSTLRYVICGGEALNGQLLTTYFERLGERVELHHSYGPTETSIASAESVCSPLYRTWRRMPMGRALANTTLYVVDAAVQPVPLGVAGELCIGGDGVARGYLHRPELTATAFIPDPFSTEPGARLYRTGDLVRYLHDGQLQFLGRVDDQVKLRGVRIELGEIEATLRRHTSVREAVAVVREFAVGDPRLVIYAVVNDEVDQAALREYLRGKLPEYLLPSAFVLLEKLPLLPSGKVNKNALPAPEITREAVADEYVAPRTAMEEMIANIWSELLGVERVGVYDNFFELGGHSLLAARIIVRLRDKFAVDVPLRIMFDTPNVADLALAVMERQTEMLHLSETNNVLAELQSLSEEEAQFLVARPSL